MVTDSFWEVALEAQDRGGGTMVAEDRWEVAKMAEDRAATE